MSHIAKTLKSALERSHSELGKGYTCDCERWHDFSKWVYAHWNDPITHVCECGRVAHLKRGRIVRIDSPEEDG